MADRRSVCDANRRECKEFELQGAHNTLCNFLSYKVNRMSIGLGLSARSLSVDAYSKHPVGERGTPDAGAFFLRAPCRLGEGGRGFLLELKEIF